MLWCFTNFLYVTKRFINKDSEDLNFSVCTLHNIKNDVMIPKLNLGIVFFKKINLQNHCTLIFKLEKSSFCFFLEFTIDNIINWIYQKNYNDMKIISLFHFYQEATILDLGFFPSSISQRTSGRFYAGTINSVESLGRSLEI